ncbi:MAG: diguanylate cyclase, partial [Chloroflexota bacterium]
VDRDLRVTRFSPLAVRVFALVAGDIGQPLLEVPTTIAVRGLDEALHAVVGGGARRSLELVGPDVSYLAQVLPYQAPDGRRLGAIITLTDVTELVRLRQAVQATLTEFTQVTDALDEVVWKRDTTMANLVYLSGGVLAMTGWTPAELAADAHALDNCIAEDDREAVLAGRTLDQGHWSLTYRLNARDGSQRWVRESASVVHDDDGDFVVGTMVDITNQQAAAEALRVAATHDPLTGLANRAALLDEITRAVSAGQRSGRSTAVLMMDLDRFKNVNDTLGHATGDDLLVAAAARIGHVMRASDLVARLGGDEFVIVMRDLDDPGEAVRVAGRLVEEFRTPFTLAGAELYSTASVGVAIVTGTTEPGITQPGTTEPGGAGDLLREADTAMYAAKEAGRDRLSVFNEDLRAATTTRLTVEADLRHALERDQFAVWYQPEIDLTTGAVIAVEALLRWHHPDGTVWPADRFIDVAEDTGLILDIGDWALRQACGQAAAWAAARPDRPLTVRVNKSALQIGETRLLPAIDDALAASGLDPAL